MERELAGHVLRDDAGYIIKVQTLTDHCRAVAEYCAAACKPLGLENTGYLTGLLHDTGKCARIVQDHLYDNTTEKINHASAGMRWLWENYGHSQDTAQLITAQLAGLAIGCHHGERLDIFSPDGSEPWLQRMNAPQAVALYDENCTVFFGQCIPESEIRQTFAQASKEVYLLCQKILTSIQQYPAAQEVMRAEYQMRLGLVSRYLFAALVDADWTDSANWYKSNKRILPEPCPPWAELADTAEHFLDALPAIRPIDTLRREISDQCAVAGQQAETGIYRLYVPTGGGKTYSGLRYCLHAAKHRNAKRIFYARGFVLGKVYNARWVLERATRDHPQRVPVDKLKRTAAQLAATLSLIETCEDPAQLLGLEGEAAQRYFDQFNALVLQQQEAFSFTGRSRRPPLDNINALLSFAYTMLAHDCAAALTAVGLDPYVGFLHRPHPGRQSLALDLMEELRTVYADRFVLSCVNQKILTAKHLQKQESGAVWLTDEGRRVFFKAWQSKKQEQITHPFLKEKLPWGLVPYVQALLLARTLRGDLDVYPPFFWK